MVFRFGRAGGLAGIATRGIGRRRKMLFVLLVPAKVPPKATQELRMNDPVAFVRRLVPSAIKDPTKDSLLRRRFAKALISFRKLQHDCSPPPTVSVGTRCGDA
jgi:hypothetical protein